MADDTIDRSGRELAARLSARQQPTLRIEIAAPTPDDAGFVTVRLLRYDGAIVAEAFGRTLAYAIYCLADAVEKLEPAICTCGLPFQVTACAVHGG